MASAAGVSTAAVSQAFNGTGRLSEATRRRILDTAAGLGWSPSATATALRSARTRTLALVVRRPTDVLGADPHFSELITGIEGELAPRGYGLLLHLVGDVAEESALYERLAAESRVDGAVLTDARADDPRPPLLRRLGLPAVLLGSPDGGCEVPTVGLGEQGAGIREAVAHLLALGHRRIAYVTGPAELLHTRLRGSVVLAELAAAGLSPSAVLHTDFTEGAAVRATDELLALPERPTAVVYANDSMAVCGIGAAQRAGLRVPDDLSVVGYDDLPLGRWLHPRLTTVDQQVQRVGAAAARVLLAQCGEDVPPAPLEGRPRLVVRDSTARAARPGTLPSL
ncbi:LacI family DNA-binding transcriptional regulator [Streptomyces tsukubensis]|uniref:LacI family transcriptional regulator n=1 Tax=Streptomyces tsukubensis TaxID=83656 RepID=A0A1V4AHE9_9ACTN|nr:LacI family DNA-binding transcriptional regulator [Streptomyces tsukubensis]OON83041.1 LacI family transcriptional regulator [Streptomyces tsukubensis]QFR97440.1 LacI family DNA-binding transcriptional regulator [Streptomyces tsukubensis]